MILNIYILGKTNSYNFIFGKRIHRELCIRCEDETTNALNSLSHDLNVTWILSFNLCR